MVASEETSDAQLIKSVLNWESTDVIFLPWSLSHRCSYHRDCHYMVIISYYSVLDLLCILTQVVVDNSVLKTNHRNMTEIREITLKNDYVPLFNSTYKLYLRYKHEFAERFR